MAESRDEEGCGGEGEETLGAQQVAVRGGSRGAPLPFHCSALWPAQVPTCGVLTRVDGLCIVNALEDGRSFLLMGVALQGRDEADEGAVSVLH
jgi:hypothetical protein